MLRAYEEEPTAFTSTATERETLPTSWWEARMRDSPEAAMRTWGAFAGCTLIGTAALEFSPRLKLRHKAALIAMYVSPPARGAGVGRGLVSAVLQHAHSIPHLHLVQLTVTADNHAARALYERNGFQLWGIEPDAVRHAGTSWAKAHLYFPLRESASAPGNP